jgi:hypothetical protein
MLSDRVAFLRSSLPFSEGDDIVAPVVSSLALIEVRTDEEAALEQHGERNETPLVLFLQVRGKGIRSAAALQD